MRNFASHCRPLFWIDALVHESAAGAPLEIQRHRFFILPHLAFAGCVLLGAPVWLALYGAPGKSEALIFLLAQAPLICVIIASRTGLLRLAQNISALGWLALAAALLSAPPGHEAVSGAFLAAALVEAVVTQEAATLVVATAALAFFIALPAGDESLATMAARLAFAAPLLLYILTLALGAFHFDRARAEASRGTARELSQLTDSLGDIVLHLDHSGAVTAILGDSHRSYGLDRNELLGRGLFQRVHIADRPAFLKLVSDSLAQAEPICADLRVKVGLAYSASGDYAEPVFNHFEARMRPARPVARSVDGAAAQASRRVVCSLRDVTAQKRAEESIAAARAESERALATKARFLAIVSHELRTPLNAIIGFSEMLADPGLTPSDPARQREYARIVADSGNHLLEVVNTILDMSKIEAGSMRISPEPFPLPALVDQCCDMVQLKADQGGVKLTRDYRNGIDDVVADKRACRQILLNLLSNAVKFTPAGGKVAVRVAPEGNHLALTVADTGIGIAATDLSRLGDPFFQASGSHDRAYEGTGLGLSVVRGLVGLHGGEISVESAPKKGTTVTVRLPLDCRGANVSRLAAAKIEIIPRHGAATGMDIRNRQDMVKKIA